MPKINELIGERRIQPGQSVVRGQTGQVAGAVNRLGNTLEGVGQRIQEREDRLNYIKAKSAFNQARVAADNAFYDDQDYKTFIPRYSDAMKQAKNAAIDSIANPMMREEFEAQADLDIEQGLQRTAQLAWMKEKDYGRGQLEGILSQNRESFLQAGSDQARASVLGNDLEAINTAKELGYISSEEAEKRRIARTVEVSAAYLDTKDPYERLRLLGEKDGYAQYIPTDMRKAMEEKAQAEIATLAVRQERARKIQSNQLHTEALSQIEASGGVIDIPAQTWNSFDAAQRNSLIQYAQKIASGEMIVTDWNRYYELAQMAIDDPAGFSELDIGLERMNLNNSDFKKMIDMQSKVTENKTKGSNVYNILTDKAAMDNALYQTIGKKPAKYSEDDKIFANAFYRIANEEMQQWLLDNPNYSKVPDEARQQIIDKMTEKMHTSKGLFGIDVLWPDAESTLVEEIVSDLEDSGKPVTSYNIFKTYQNAKKAGVID